ncbi:unnamed protein product, partial [Amoebophrya sp. A25]
VDPVFSRVLGLQLENLPTGADVAALLSNREFLRAIGEGFIRFIGNVTANTTLEAALTLQSASGRLGSGGITQSAAAATQSADVQVEVTLSVFEDTFTAAELFELINNGRAPDGGTFYPPSGLAPDLTGLLRTFLYGAIAEQAALMGSALPVLFGGPPGSTGLPPG